jgi:hypothetical protein
MGTQVLQEGTLTWEFEGEGKGRHGRGGRGQGGKGVNQNREDNMFAGCQQTSLSLGRGRRKAPSNQRPIMNKAYRDGVQLRGGEKGSSTSPTRGHVSS